jgi:hypothetical protein
MAKMRGEGGAARMARKREAWAHGAAEGKAMEHLRFAGMTYEERIAEGLGLVRIAHKLQAGRRKRLK